ncbi:MAG: hypothetical protein GX063_06445 [Firmicutes bacterium]|nr:hypothetical protein [Bacillota bacterium]
MRKSWGILAMLVLILGLVCGVVMAEDKPLYAKQDVELELNVHEWAEIVKIPKSMTLDLTKPGDHQEVKDWITVSANTNVKVSVTSVSLSIEQEEKGELVDYGVGFRDPADESTSRLPKSNFDVGAGEEKTVNIVFWAKWTDDQNKWYQLVAGSYEGTATITVAATK